MIPKVLGLLRALQGGVSYAHIINGNISHNLLIEIFTTEGIGTMVTTHQ